MNRYRWNTALIEAFTAMSLSRHFMKHIVNFSGGLCSFWAAKRVVAKESAANVTLLFADVLIEDPELYAFNQWAADHLEVPITRVSRELTPWQLFRQQGMIANNRFPICSIYLKREVLDKWLRENCEPAATVVYLGFDWTEQHRIEHIRKAQPAWRWEAPMTEEPIWDKCRMLKEALLLGYQEPTLYKLGFPHNNCGGRCVRAGLAHWERLWRTLPERFLEWEREEEQTIAELTERGVSSAWFSFLRDRRGGTTKTMTLAAFRARLEAGETFDRTDWGGCGCAGAIEEA